ncbi:MAG: YceI family protein [Candidatus Competibacterales bacterium]
MIVPLRVAAVVAALGSATAASPALAESWQIDHDQSALRFVFSQEGSGVEGEFRDFSAEMVFDPDDLANSGFDVTIDVTSVDTGLVDRDELLAASDWFGFDDFPKARFVTKRFEALGDHRYRAVADLTIRAITQEVELPFTWTVDGGTAEMDGETVLDRTRFEVGTGEWSSDETVGFEVEVKVDLTLTASPSS